MVSVIALSCKHFVTVVSGIAWDQANRQSMQALDRIGHIYRVRVTLIKQTSHIFLTSLVHYITGALLADSEPGFVA